MEQEVGNEARSSRDSRQRACFCLLWRRQPGAGTKTGRHSQDRPFRQPGQHVDARGIDAGGQPADDRACSTISSCSSRTSRKTPRTSIVPELATGWTWSEDGTELTFPLHQGVKWHDGKPFTAADVKCTIELLQGKAKEKLRINPRKSWFDNVSEVTTKGDYEVTFHLKRPQPSLLAMLATGWTPIYPCHVSPAQMRQHPIGTGPFKFVEFKPNQSITVVRNPDYWKPGRPYLDGIEYRIIQDVSTRLLSFIAGNEDVYFGVTMPQLKDVKNQVPQAICDMTRDERRPQSARQPRRAAVRQSRVAAGDVADDRPSGVRRHHRRRTGSDRRGHAAAARRAYGACRPTRCATCRATTPISHRAAPRPARSWRSWATARITG